MTVIGPSDPGFGFLLAGHYGPEAMLDSEGVLLKNTQVTVRTAAGAMASIYANKNKTTAIANPTTTDALGNLLFYADPGDYTIQLVVSGVAAAPIPISIEPDVSEIESIGGLTEVSTDVQRPGINGNPAMLNGWTDTGGSNEGFGFYIDAADIVRVIGVITGGTALGIYTLPTGYRSLKNHLFRVDANTGSLELQVTSVGGLTLGAGSLSGLTYVSMDGIAFRREQ